MNFFLKPQKVKLYPLGKWLYEPRVTLENGTNLQWFDKKFTTAELANQYIFRNLAEIRKNFC